jgi:hypothetical protein
MKKYLDLIEEYNFKFIELSDKELVNYEIIQTGIGDLLLASLCIKNNLFDKKILFNIYIYINNICDIINNYDSFLFKIKLLNKIINNNEIFFYYNKNVNYTTWPNKIKLITNYNLLKHIINIPVELNQKYIIFHTKCRFYKKFNYKNMKNQLYNFFKNYKTNYKIYLLGEKNMSINYESKVHKITTIYDELKLLKNNNNVIDLTKDNIYDNLDFDNYLNDIQLINEAYCNIGVGCGGQFVSSIIFSNKALFYESSVLMSSLNVDNLKSNNIEIIYDLSVFFKKIHDII